MRVQKKKLFLPSEKKKKIQNDLGPEGLPLKNGQSWKLET